jgi:hypothetical protein
MVEPLRHRQTKGAETDMPGLPPPRHIPTLPVRLPIRVFVVVFDTVDLVTQPINLIEKSGCARAHDLEMLSVAGQEILPTRYTRHGHLTQRSSPGAALSAMLLNNVLP